MIATFTGALPRKIARTAGLCLAALATLLTSSPTVAHEVRPAFLHIKDLSTAETTRFDVLWKQPVVQNGRLAIDPVFPEGCELVDLAPPEVTSSALLHYWTTDCDLSDAQIHISGLSVTLTDVLV